MGPLLLFLLGRSVLTDIRRTASDSLCVRLISQVVFGAFEAVHEPSGSSGPYKLVKLVTIHPSIQPWQKDTGRAVALIQVTD